MNDADITVLHMESGTTDRAVIYRRISCIMFPAGELLLGVITWRLGECFKVKGLLPGEQCSIFPDSSTMDIMFDVSKRRAEGIGTPLLLVLH